MNQQDFHSPGESFERWLDASVQRFSYPQTPNLATEWRQHQARQHQLSSKPRRLIWVAAVVIIALLLADSPVRTTVLEIMSRASIRIFLLEPYQATLTPTVTATLPAMGGLRGSSFLTLQPTPAATPITAVLEAIKVQPNAAGGAHLFRAAE